LKPSEKVLIAGEWVRVYRDQALAKQIDKGGILERAMRAATQVAVDVAKQAPSATTPQQYRQSRHREARAHDSAAPPPPPPPPQ